MRHLLPLLVLLAAAFGSAGCVYRPNIQQGNLLEAEDVDQVTVGMTRSQVRYVLGTPMVSDPFHPDRWDYVYSLKVGRTRKADTAHLVVHFADDKVTRVERLEAPRPKPAPKATGDEKKDGAEPPPEPSEPPPQPDASRPGSG
jgi:outer membrane protein assembly factor BamE